MSLLPELIEWNVRPYLEAAWQWNVEKNSFGFEKLSMQKWRDRNPTRLSILDFGIFDGIPVLPMNRFSPFFCLMEVRLLQSVLRAPAVLLPAQQNFGEVKNCLLHFASVPKNVRTHGSQAWSTSKACHIKSYRMTQEKLKWHIERSETSNFEATLRFGLGKGTLIHVRLERGCWLPGLLVENSGELLYQMHFTEIQERRTRTTYCPTKSWRSSV